ncbi:MAG TPA: sulfatase-like hydrolase/transferase [Acidobacteriota bacterium]|nr:sulfatase-like hydrolase/transferase [Acidobacteriota bacterium]
MYELLARYAEFFVFKRISRTELIIFTFVLSLLIPGILLLIRFLISKLAPTAGRIFYWLLITAFTLAFVLPGMNRQNFIDSHLFMVSLVVVCAITSVGYFRFPWLRLFYLYLASALIIMPVVFLISPKIWRLMFSKPIDIPNVTLHAQTPIIFVVFDEFPVISLLDENRNVDAARYPNFARLAHEWNWYRTTSTVAERTPESLSAILTGMYPKKDSLPTTVHYPKNLFTLFGKSYDLNVFETVTWMDPSVIAFEKDEVEFWKSLFSDLSLVYLHIILPRMYSMHLPSITQSWGDFASNSEKGKTDRHIHSKNPDTHLLTFLDSIHATKTPAIHFIHAKAPHSPWYLLPSGKNFGSQTYEGMNLVFAKWSADQAAVQRAYQRHLLQVGYVDQWIGKLIAKLQKLDLYDRSVIVITADHGVSFTPDNTTRTVTPRNAEEIVFVPLFIKAPGQKIGRILDWNTETIDIVPTVAELAGVNIPWKVDGVSLVKNPPSEQRARLVCSEYCKKRYRFDGKYQFKNQELQRKLTWFGSGKKIENLSAPCREIIGQQANRSQTAQGVSLSFRNPEQFSNVSFQLNLIPVFVAGRIHMSYDNPKQFTLAISVNGIYRATTVSVPLDAKTHNFDALVPEESLQAGKNDVQIFLLPSCSEMPQRIVQQ